jgi:hypothetical protein
MPAKGELHGLNSPSGLATHLLVLLRNGGRCSLTRTASEQLLPAQTRRGSLPPRRSLRGPAVWLRKLAHRVNHSELDANTFTTYIYAAIYAAIHLRRHKRENLRSYRPRLMGQGARDEQCVEASDEEKPTDQSVRSKNATLWVLPTVPPLVRSNSARAFPSEGKGVRTAESPSNNLSCFHPTELRTAIRSSPRCVDQEMSAKAGLRLEPPVGQDKELEGLHLRVVSPGGLSS